MLHLALSAIPFLFAFLVLYGALSDLSTFRIPNWVSYGLLLLFALHSFLTWLATPYMPSLGGFRLPPYAFNIAIALLVFVVSLAFWKMRMVGGGDVKYLTATSLWMGPQLAAPFIVLLTVLAIVLVLTLKIISNWGFLVQGTRLPLFVKRLLSKLEVNQLPYGFPIGLAALAMIPWVFKI
jgi:prepilin peptidase CpaA